MLERERDRQTERHRQTDRQTDTDRESNVLHCTKDPHKGQILSGVTIWVIVSDV